MPGRTVDVRIVLRRPVLPIGGVSYKIEAAVDAGIPKVIVPKAKLKDIDSIDNKQKIDLNF